MPAGGAVCVQSAASTAVRPRRRVHGVFLGGWPALDLACQNCTEPRATWDKVSEMCVEACYCIIKCKVYRCARLAEGFVNHS